MMGRSTFYSKNYVGWPPVHFRLYNDPNSSHWQEMCGIAAKAFDKLPLSKEGWRAFQALFKGEMLTWKRGYEIYTEATAAYAPGVSVDWLAWKVGILPEEPECDCFLPEHTCLVCVAQARQMNIENELPY